MLIYLSTYQVYTQHTQFYQVGQDAQNFLKNYLQILIIYGSLFST